MSGRSSKLRVLLLLSVMQASSIGMMQLPAVAVTAPLTSPVRLAGQSVFAIKKESGGLSASARAAAIQRNLDNALVATANPGPSSVGVVYVKGEPIVTLGGYYVVTVDSATATAEKSTPTVLAQKWAKSLKNALADSKSTKEYVAQLSGVSSVNASNSSNSNASSPSAPPADAVQDENPVPPYDTPSSAYDNAVPANNTAGPPSVSPTPIADASSKPKAGVKKGRIIYVPAGMTIPVKLAQSVSSTVARPGDLVEVRVSQAVDLDGGVIPVNTQIIGQVTDASAGSALAKTGSITLKFTRLVTPQGIEVPIQAHIVGSVEGYGMEGQDKIKAESTEDKIKRALKAGAVGAGAGSALGTAIGGIAGSGRGAMKGAWSGAAIGATLGVAESLLARKGADVVLTRGSSMKIQLDSPTSIIASR